MESASYVSNYSINAISNSIYSIPYTSTLPGGVTLRGVQQTLLLPNGANMTAITAISNGSSYTNVDNWKVNISRDGLKLAYIFTNWPRNLTGVPGRSIWVQTFHTCHYIAKEEAQFFPLIPIDKFPVSYREVNGTAPYDIVNTSAPISIPPKYGETVYNDRRASSTIKIGWFRRSMACSNSSSSATCSFPDLSSFRLSGQDVLDAIFAVKGQFQEAPIPFNFTFPVVIGLEIGRESTFTSWDPNFEILFVPPETDIAPTSPVADAALNTGISTAVRTPPRLETVLTIFPRHFR